MNKYGLSRRAFMLGSAGLAGAVALAAVPVVLRRAGPAAAEGGPMPFPTLAQGRLVPLDLGAYESAMLSGGPGKDGIPSIDNPKFWDVLAANDYLDDNDIVFGLVENGIARAYPQRILVWHEVVNDNIEGMALAVTYCPLTGTAITFQRGETEFGVSGRLVNSNLIMYDRQTDTWFPQVLAVGIRGRHAGVALVERPLIWTTWERWRAAYPGTEVLSTETGFFRNYRSDPYGEYNEVAGYYLPDSATMFPLMHRDDRYPAKSSFLGARTAHTAVAIRLERLRDERRMEFDGGSERFTAIYDEALDSGYIFRGTTDAEASFTKAGPYGVTWMNGAAPEPINTMHAMWFAWSTYYPESIVHG